MISTPNIINNNNNQKVSIFSSYSSSDAPAAPSSSFQSLAETIQKDIEEQKLTANPSSSSSSATNRTKSKQELLEAKRRREKLALVKTSRRNITAEEAFSLALSNVHHSANKTHYTTNYLDLMSVSDNNSSSAIALGLEQEAVNARLKIAGATATDGEDPDGITASAALKKSIKNSSKQKHLQRKQFAEDVKLFERAKENEESSKLQQKALRQMKLKEGVFSLLAEYEQKKLKADNDNDVSSDRRRLREEEEEEGDSNTTQTKPVNSAAASTKPKTKKSVLDLALSD